MVLANSPSLDPMPVKSKRSTAMPCALSASEMRRAAKHVLAAGEAMGEQRIGAGLAGRQVEHGGEFFASGIGKIEALGGHGKSPCVLSAGRLAHAGAARAHQLPARFA